jgi:hypothetical protein
VDEFKVEDVTALTLEECFPTASPEEIARLRKEGEGINFTSAYRVTYVDEKNKEIFLEYLGKRNRNPS